ncbi:MAG: hypothetical protein WAT39_25795 [Planctomycetota bacterium]
MNHFPVAGCLLALTLAAPGLAQVPEFLLTFSQPENTLSGSGATVLGALAPNEVAKFEWFGGPCSSVSSEKFTPRTCLHTMAGDENGNAIYWNPTLFGAIDALCTPPPNAIGAGINPRSVYWSPSAAMGTFISGLPFRPGDVARIVNTPSDGSIQYFMRQEQFNQALGLPTATPIDVDAIAWSPNYGVIFSLDSDITVTNACGTFLLRDGDIVCVPGGAVTWTPGFQVAAVVPGSGMVIYTEAQIDALVVAAQITNRFGICIPNAIDLESIDLDWSPVPPPPPATPCAGIVVPRPHLVFATESMTGGGLLTTVGGGTIFVGPCGPLGTSCTFGPTLGTQVGLRPPTPGLGVPSHVNALASARTARYALEPQQHVQAVFPTGAVFGATSIAMGSPFVWNFVFIELVPPTVPGSITVAPTFSAFCFPDLYTPSLFSHAFVPAPTGFASFPMVGIPPLWTGKVLYQSVGLGGSGFELSTPTVIDVQ